MEKYLYYYNDMTGGYHKNTANEPSLLVNNSVIWVVYSINGNVIGVCDSFGKALSLYEEQYGDTPTDTSYSLRRGEMNKLGHI